MGDRPIRLIYGKDPFSEGEHISLIVFDQNETDLSNQLYDAKTWGDALRGYPDIWKALNEYRWEGDEPPLKAEDPFDYKAESEPEYGLVYLTAVRSEINAANLVSALPREELKDHVRFESGMVDCFRCFLRNDDSASLVADLLTAQHGAPVTIERSDSHIGWLQEGLFQ